MKDFGQYIIPLVVLLTIVSCDNPINDTSVISDAKLKELAYSEVKWPANFYQEDLSGGSIYYENTISIKPSNERGDSWIELCTDDVDKAREWSDLSSQYSSYYRELVSENETEKYYEFNRVYSENPSHVLLSRVHKCSYLDRTMYDFFKAEGVLGIFNKTDVNQSDVNELIEYLWFVDHYNMAGDKVHVSKTEETTNEYIHTLYSVNVVYGDWGVQDRISYVKNSFHIERETGEITYDKEVLKEIVGSHN